MASRFGGAVNDGITVRGPTMTEIEGPVLEDMTDPETLLKTANTCASGVRWKASVQRFEIDQLRWIATIRREVTDRTFKGRGFKRFDIVERGKLRHIQSVHISERMVQKLLCNEVLKPVVYPRLIYDNTASQEGKGVALALKRLKEHLRWRFARYGKAGGILLMDYHDFFASIPHEELIQGLFSLYDDRRLDYFVRFFIDAFDGDRGLGLGSETSQVGAIYYPTPIDKLLSDQLGIHCRARYMDDSYAIHHDRHYLEWVYDVVRDAAKFLGIQVNEKKTTIRPLTDDFVFLKKRVHIEDSGRIVLRLTRENIAEERRRILVCREEYDAGRMSAASVWQSYQSWRGYAKQYNGYKTVGAMDQFFATVMKGVNFDT